MSDPRDYKLDIASDPSIGKPTEPHASRAGRPFISVRFACCNQYARVYRSADGTRYDARCPRCGKTVTFAVGPGGTDSRSFVVE